MAKLDDRPIDKSDLIDFLNSYSDFSFELQVLKMLRDQDIECQHGGHYTDPATKKSREFDIRAQKTIGRRRVRLAIECKNIRDNFPVLVSCMPRNIEECYHEIAIIKEPCLNNGLSVYHRQASRVTTLSIQGAYSIYEPTGIVGKSTSQVGRALSKITSNDAEIYEKWGQCLSSAQDLVDDLYWDGKDGKTNDPFFSAIIPMVVIPNGRLWKVTYNGDGSRLADPEQTDRCSFYVGKNYTSMPGLFSYGLSLSHVELLTYDGLSKFISNYLVSNDGIEKVFHPIGIADAYQRSLHKIKNSEDNNEVTGIRITSNGPER